MIFGLTHGNLVQFIYATVLGILMAIVYEIYDSLLASILFHSIANLFVYIVLDLSPVGGAFLMPASCAFFMLMTGISAVMMVKLQKGKE